MARGQGDYYQATRGGGHGDYRHLVLGADGRQRGRRAHCQLAFHLAETWRNPVMIFGDYYLAHTYQSVDVQPIDFGPVPVKEWALDGSSRWHRAGEARLPARLDTEAVARPRHDLEAHYEQAGRQAAGDGPGGGRSESGYRRRRRGRRRRVRHAGQVHPLRRCSSCGPRAPRSASSGPITLFPFPSEAMAAAAEPGRPRGRRLREQPGSDDRRRAPGGAGPRAGRVHRRARPRQLGLRHRARPRRRGPVADPRRDRRKERWHDRRPRCTSTRSRPPDRRRAGSSTTSRRALLDVGDHHLCPGCGEPIAMRSRSRPSTSSAVASARSPCSASAATPRSPTTSTSRCCRRCTAGRRRWPPASSGPARHRSSSPSRATATWSTRACRRSSTPPPAARTSPASCLNNGVFGETGGHMTATTVLGQRTKNTLDGRDADDHGYPDPAQQPARRARRRRLRRPRRGQQRRQRRPDQAMILTGVRDAVAGRGLLVRRDPHHVPHRLVHRDRRRRPTTSTRSWVRST